MLEKTVITQILKYIRAGEKDYIRLAEHVKELAEDLLQSETIIAREIAKDYYEVRLANSIEIRQLVVDYLLTNKGASKDDLDNYLENNRIIWKKLNRNRW